MVRITNLRNVKQESVLLDRREIGFVEVDKCRAGYMKR